MKKNNSYAEITIIIFIIIGSILFSLGIGIKRHGDDASYYSMVSSFLEDGDFILDDRDLQRFSRSELKAVPAGAYVLIDEKGVMRYAKPILYPLIAAPFYLLGIRGLALLNGLFLGLSITLGYLFLRKDFSRNNSVVLSIAFFFCSFMPAYVSWIHPEVMLFFSCSLCMWFWLGKERTIPVALITGIVSTVRIEFFLLFILLVVVLVIGKRFKDSRQAITVFLSSYTSMLILTFFFFGRFSPYGAERYFIPGKMGKPYLTFRGLADSLIVAYSMFENSGFNSLGLFFRNITNFFIGRYTGIIWYSFPAVVCAGVYLFYRGRINKEKMVFGDTVLAILFLLAIILVISRPLNYFGGRDFVFNRYMSILPVLLFMPGLSMIKRPAGIVLLFLPGLIISAQIIKNEIFRNDEKNRYFIHTVSFPLKYAPMEVAQVESLMIHNLRLKISDNLFVYPLSGNKQEAGGKIFFSKGEELVFVQDKGEGDIALVSDTGKIILRPRFTLRNKVNGERKSFYYFKSGSSGWIRVIQT